MKQISDEQLIIHLQNMPKVHDHLPEEEWIKRVEPGAYKRQRQRRQKRSIMMPLLSTALMLGILVLILPTFFGNQSSTLEEASTTSEMDMGSKELSTILTDQSEEETAATESNLELITERGKYVIYEIGDDEQLVYAGIVDQQAQFLIPLTFVSSNSTSLSEAYNALENDVERFDRISSVPYFSEVTFEIDETDDVVTMHTTPDYSIGEGSAIQGKFEEMVSFMFHPYGIEKVIFEQASGEPVSLGEMGEFKELYIQQPVQSIYKIYYDVATEQSFFTPIHQEGVPFSEAVEDLKNGDSDFSIQQTIPEDVHLMVVCEDVTCTIDFGESAEDLSEEETLVAIESLLMTAKSYGYSMLQFIGLPYEVISGYDTSHPINVPLGVNPIDLKE